MGCSNIPVPWRTIGRAAELEGWAACRSPREGQGATGGRPLSTLFARLIGANSGSNVRAVFAMGRLMRGGFG